MASVPQRARSYVFLCIGLAAVFTMAAFSLQIFGHDLDTHFSKIVSEHKGFRYDAVMTFISWWGMSMMMVVPVFVAALLFRLVGWKREAVFVFAAFAADAFNIVLKILFNRQRPGSEPIFPSFQKASFPSGHVVHYVVFFGFILAVLMLRPRVHPACRWGLGALCAFLVAGVGIARVYLNAHWPTDSFAGYAAGFAMLAAMVHFYAKDLRV